MKYRKKPVVIDAIAWDGTDEAYDAILSLATTLPSPAPEVQTRSLQRNEDGTLDISTLEGTMKAGVGDFVIRGVSRELYPCKPDIFEKTYEVVDG